MCTICMFDPNKELYDNEDWTIETIEKTWEVIDKIAKEKYNLDYYKPDLTIINSEAMLDAYSSNAMPIYYNHWSFGKSYAKNENKYKKGQLGLAYEVVINTDPCIAYLQSSNSMTMQALVMAHAAVGHSAFFKNNFLFKEWTDPTFILPYLQYSKDFVKECEIKYGRTKVENILDAAHAFSDYGVDTYKKSKESWAKEIDRVEKIKESDYIFSMVKHPSTVTIHELDDKVEYKKGRFLPEENILYFIEKMAPNLEQWERELVRIVRQVSQYFYPQMQTKVMNEGFATFMHYHLMSDLWEGGYISSGAYLRFIDYHTMVVNQQDMSPHLNPYVLGFKMFMDIKRICENPTEEDVQWFPFIANTDWLTTIKNIVESYKDSSFIEQFLSPRLIRELKLVHLSSKAEEGFYTVSNTHAKEDVKDIREAVSSHYDLMYFRPRLEISHVNWTTDRRLFLSSYGKDRYLLSLEESQKALHLLKEYLWGFEIELRHDDGGELEGFEE